MRLAYSTIPIESGVYSHFCTLRDGLARRGIEVVGVSVGRATHGELDALIPDPSCLRIAANEEAGIVAAKAFVEWASDTKVDCVISVGDPVINAATQFLPDPIARVGQCYSNTLHSYRVSTYARDALDYIIATTPRQRDDLQHLGVRGELIELIPHSVDSTYYRARRSFDSFPLRIGYLGRLDEYGKGLMNLPRVAEILAGRGVKFDLRIAGSGPDAEALSLRLGECGFRPEGILVGALTLARVPAFLASVDVLLFPSRFEGFGIVLIEAMAAGVVPVASRIRGVTDFIIEDGRTGFLVGIDDVVGMANAVEQLSNSPTLREAMSEAGFRSVEDRFNSESMSEAYVGLFRKAPRPGRTRNPRPWSEFCLNPAFRPNWGSRLPQPVKAALRRWAEWGRELRR